MVSFFGHWCIFITYHNDSHKHSYDSLNIANLERYFILSIQNQIKIGESYEAKVHYMLGQLHITFINLNVTDIVFSAPDIKYYYAQGTE